LAGPSADLNDTARSSASLRSGGPSVPPEAAAAQRAGTRLRRAFARRGCEHVAALVKSADELAQVQAAFLSLGAARNGWLVHGALPGHAADDATRLAKAGLDVAALKASKQLEVMELDLELSPEEWVRPWRRLLDDRLNAGFSALWFTRFPVRADEREIADILPFEEAWTASFEGRPVVTLCPYMFALAPADRSLAGPIAAAHDRVIDFLGR
jgi:hypothetical protein